MVAYVGRLAPEKNLGLLMDAFDAIRRLAPGARLLLVGDGPSQPALQTRRPEAIFAGVRHDTDLAAHYASADLFLFPSLTETFGNVTAEALASGLAVVAFDCAAASDLIEHGRNGLLATPGDAGRFVEHAVTLAADPARRQSLRNQAARSIHCRDWERVHDAFADALYQVLRRHERRRENRHRLIPAVD